MAKALSVLSWNVKHFGATEKNKTEPRKPVEPIIRLMADQNADVVAIYEVVGSVVYETIIDEMKGYQFHITEGPQSQEILVGVKKSLTSFFTQRVEFKSGQSTLRPGALLTVKTDTATYPLLFLHLKSMTKAKGFGLRDDMTERALKFRKALDRSVGGPGKANFIFMGDLNTMGMSLSYCDKGIGADDEIDRLKKRAVKKRMRVLEKSHPFTYWPGSGASYDPGDLDHVVAADHLTFKSFGGKPVDVRGWPEKSSDAQRDAWAKKYSDHAMLFFQIEKP